MAYLVRMKYCLLLTVIAVAIAFPLKAQTVPSAAQPGRATEHIRPETPLPSQPQPAIVVPTQQEEIPEGAEEIRFPLRALRVHGMSVYNRKQLDAILKPYLDREVSLNDIYVISQQLTQKYLDDGYILSRVVVPQQKVTDGRIELQAVEGFIDKVSFQRDGVIRTPTRMQRRIAKKIESSRPLKLSVLERNMLLMNDMPGTTARAVLQASPQTFGAANLFVLITRKRLSGYVQADNRGSRYQGPLEYLGGISVNQVFDDTDQLNLRYARSYQKKELQYGEIGYTRQLSADGLRLSILANQNLTRPGAQLEPFEIKGEDRTYEARLSYPLIRERQTTADIYGTFDWRDISSDVLGTPLSRDHIRALRAGISYQNFDAWLGSNTAQLEFSQGLDIMGASQKNDDISRPNAAAGFQKLTAQLSREQMIPNSNWSIFGGVSGQYAPRALLASEEFGLGGERIGGAYDSSEITGDSGIGGRLEARYLVIPDTNKILQSAQPYAFYDIGMVRNIDPGTGQNPTETLASAGAGVRMALSYGFAVSLEVAKPLSRNVAALNSNSPRVFFKVSKVF